MMDIIKYHVNRTNIMRVNAGLVFISAMNCLLSPSTFGEMCNEIDDNEQKSCKSNLNVFFITMGIFLFQSMIDQFIFKRASIDSSITNMLTVWYSIILYIVAMDINQMWQKHASLMIPIIIFGIILTYLTCNYDLRSNQDSSKSRRDSTPKEVHFL